MARRVRKDSDRVVLQKGESQRKNGTYCFRWVDISGVRHSVYAPTLALLRDKEKEIDMDIHDGIRADMRNRPVNEFFDLWSSIKRGVKENTMQNYRYMYNKFVRPSFGRLKLADVRKSDVRQFYLYLADKIGMKASTIDNIHNVLHQVFDMAIDDRVIRINPASRVMREIKRTPKYKSQKRHALTIAQENMFLDYLKKSETYRRWYPVFAVMLGTGMRAGETTGLRWCDVDFDEGYIDINHTMVYYSHEGEEGCRYDINTPKSEAGNRRIPMLDFVRDALIEEQTRQKEMGLKCRTNISGYSDFIFLHDNGSVINFGHLNKLINHVIKAHNEEALALDPQTDELLPSFSCHILRHSFATRMCEAGVNVKVMQDVLGHSDVTITLGIYAEATKDLKIHEFDGLGNYFKDIRKTSFEDM